MKKLVEILEEKEERIREMILEIKNDFVEMNHGLTIIENNDCFQISTNSQVSEIVEKFLKNDLKEEISPASLETLSIIAYKGPIIKPEIDNIRGVNSVFVLRNLMIRGLIEREKSNEKGIFAYRISFDMMKKLGIDKIDNLPDYNKYNSKDNFKEDYNPIDNQNSDISRHNSDDYQNSDIDDCNSESEFNSDDNKYNLE